MVIPADLLRTHLDYTVWASTRLLAEAAQLSPEELTRDFGTADHSIIGTLAHIFSGDRAWLSRVNGGPDTGPAGSIEFVELQSAWSALLNGWLDWARSLTDAGAVQEISYRDWKGRPWTAPVWQIVLHVVNHGSAHRGQVAGFLRAMGRIPPPLDMTVYYREQAAVLKQNA